MARTTDTHDTTKYSIMCAQYSGRLAEGTRPLARQPTQYQVLYRTKCVHDGAQRAIWRPAAGLLQLSGFSRPLSAPFLSSHCPKTFPDEQVHPNIGLAWLACPHNRVHSSSISWVCGAETRRRPHGQLVYGIPKTAKKDL